MDIIAVSAFILLFVVGAVVGSFLNVVIYRLPRGETVIGMQNSSHCPRCGRKLSGAELIPMLSWILLKGRCRTCGVKISSRYFGVELLTALLFVGAFLAIQFDPVPGEPDLGYKMAHLAHSLILISLFVPIIFIDQDLQIVPDELSVPLLLVGLVWNVIQGLTGHAWLVSLNTHKLSGLYDLSIPTSLAFAALCAGIFWIIQWLGEVVFQKPAMGLGDANIAAGIGANFPLLHALCSFGIAIGVGAFFGVLLILLRRRDKTSEMAFGPMLLAGALIMLLMPGPVEHWVRAYRMTLGGV